MMPIIYIDGAPVSMYFLMGLLGCLVSIILLHIKRRSFNLSRRDIREIALFSMFGVLTGARLFKIVGLTILHGAEPDFWTAENWRVVSSGVGVFYGGFLASIGMLVLLAKIRHIDLKNIFNAYAYATPTFLMFGRIGCYYAGCCYGITLSNGERLPVQLIEAGFCAVVLLIFLLVKPERRWSEVPLLPVYIAIYAIGRFILEFFRGDESRGVFWLSTSQWISIVLVGIISVWLYRYKLRPKIEGSILKNRKETIL